MVKICIRIILHWFRDACNPADIDSWKFRLINIINNVKDFNPALVFVFLILLEIIIWPWHLIRQSQISHLIKWVSHTNCDQKHIACKDQQSTQHHKLKHKASNEQKQTNMIFKPLIWQIPLNPARKLTTVGCSSDSDSGWNWGRLTTYVRVKRTVSWSDRVIFPSHFKVWNKTLRIVVEQNLIAC